MVGIETNIDPSKMTQRLDHEPGSNQEGQSQAEFTNYKCIPQSAAPWTRSGRSATFLQRLVQLKFGSIQCRNQAECDSCAERNRDREEEYKGVDPGACHARSLRRKQPHQDLGSPDCKCQPHRCADHREHSTFDQELTNDLGAAGPQRGADCNFFLPPGRAHEQKISNISAGDEQNQAHRSQQDKKRGTSILDYLVMQSNQGHSPTLRFRILLLDAASDRVHFRLRLHQRYAWFEAGDRAVVMKLPTLRL